VLRRYRPNGENIVTAGCGDFDSAFDVLLTFHLAEIEFLVHGSPRLVCALIELI
jgi:hypothetical protein